MFAEHYKQFYAYMLSKNLLMAFLCGEKKIFQFNGGDFEEVDVELFASDYQLTPEKAKKEIENINLKLEGLYSKMFMSEEEAIMQAEAENNKIIV